MSEEAILRKLVADGDGTGDDRRICQLFQLVHMLGKSNVDTKRFGFTSLPITNM
jgi:hypothetical protein